MQILGPRCVLLPRPSDHCHYPTLLHVASGALLGPSASPDTSSATDWQGHTWILPWSKMAPPMKLNNSHPQPQPHPTWLTPLLPGTNALFLSLQFLNLPLSSHSSSFRGSFSYICSLNLPLARVITTTHAPWVPKLKSFPFPRSPILGQCHVVIYKKYIFDHSEDQNLCLICIWSSFTVALMAHSSPSSWNFLRVESDQGVSCCVNDVSFGKHLRLGVDCQWDRPVIRPPGRGARLELKSTPLANDLVNHVYVIKPP